MYTYALGYDFFFSPSETAVVRLMQACGMDGVQATRSVNASRHLFTHSRMKLKFEFS